MKYDFGIVGPGVEMLTTLTVTAALLDEPILSEWLEPSEMSTYQHPVPLTYHKEAE